MNVKLLNYTGCGHSNANFAAALLAYTKNTRLEQGVEGFEKFLSMPQDQLDQELDYISKTLRSSWEFIDFHFQINGVTRAFTHQLVRTRTASYAQQAQRVVDLGSAGVAEPEAVANDPEAHAAWHLAITAIRHAYKAAQAVAPNQDARGIVPTNILTNICVKVNLRTLADMVGKRQNLRAQGEYADVARKMAECAIEVMPWVKSFLYPDRLRTPALDELLKEALGNKAPVDLPRVNEALKEVDMLKATWG